uniref:Methyltransf_11 domain-containing protein n=1 Tax=Ganoderma boninense TaxID=34458 RepID=A0A5K1JZU1_9APHY|nr:Methyltransf_11 domain-containing protein [Ganoderma boninense]
MPRRPQSASSAFGSSMSVASHASHPVDSFAPSALPHRFSSSQQQAPETSRRLSKLPDLLTRKRTASLPPKKDKEGARDPFTSHPSGSSSFVTYEGASPPAVSSSMSSPSSSSHPPPNPLVTAPKRARGSLLLSSGIALPFSRQRSKGKKMRPPPPPTQFLFSEVIEISAPPPRPPEDEDRDRLRDAAAQSIGLDPVLLEDHAYTLATIEITLSVKVAVDLAYSAEDGPCIKLARRNPRYALSAAIPGDPIRARTVDPAHFPGGEASSADVGHTIRSGEAMEDPRTCPDFLAFPDVGSHVAHLHVFKSDGANERELERVEIGADSWAFVADEEIGGRRGVVRVVGVGGAEMTLSMADQSEWINAIKQAVLSERSVRAGLGAMTLSNGVEPRGDLDVMLSMRAQGIFAAPPPVTTSATMASVASSQSGTISGPAASSPTPSLRSSSPQLPRPPSVAVSALRGLFGGNRPRSPSAPNPEAHLPSITDRDGAETPPPLEDSSFGRAGTSLLSMLRSNSISSERPLSPTTPVPSVPNTPRVGTTMPSDLPIQMGLITPSAPGASLDQKIVQDHDRNSLLPSIGRDRSNGLGLIGVNGGSIDEHVTRFHGNGITPFSASLQPPPRRRAWTASGAPPSASTNGSRNRFTYTHTNLSTAETLGVRHNGSAFLSPHSASPALSASTSPSMNSPSTTSSQRFSPTPEPQSKPAPKRR